MIKAWNRLSSKAVASLGDSPGEIQNLIGQSPEQPDLNYPSLGRTLYQTTSEGPVQLRILHDNRTVLHAYSKTIKNDHRPSLNIFIYTFIYIYFSFLYNISMDNKSFFSV